MPLILTDEECAAAMLGCDSMECDVTDFELRFISSNLTRRSFTDRQKEVVVRMIEKYEGHGLPADWRTRYAHKPMKAVVEAGDAINDSFSPGIVCARLTGV